MKPSFPMGRGCCRATAQNHLHPTRHRLGNRLTPPSSWPLRSANRDKSPGLFRAIGSLMAVAQFCVATAAEFHVAPPGSPLPNIDPAHRFASLREARDAARQVPTTEPRRILIHDGDYYDVGLSLEPEDSGLEITAAPGARPVLYGGHRLTGWERETGTPWWSAPLPPLSPREADVKAGLASPGWEVRLLLVHGQTRPRARFPAQGALEHTTRFDVPWMSTTGGGWKRPPTQEELTTLEYRPGDLGDWPDLTQAEITAYHMWDESCVGVAQHDPANHRLTLAPPCGHPPGAFGVRRYVLWNLRAGLTQPGQWLHDRERNRILYWPLADEDPSTLVAVAPARFTLLRLAGRPDAPVQDVVVRGLTFSATTVPLVAGGFAATRLSGAISLDRAERCTFEDLVIRGVGGHAVKATGRIQDIVVQRCEIHDCGAGGLYVGGQRAILRDNHVHGIGRSYPSGIGIYNGGTDCLVTHNEVHDCSYSAINYGGRGNVVSHNLLYDCMKVLHDGAAIYMFAATNCILRGNFARDITDTGGYGASAYYLDERSSGCVVEHNVSLRVGWPAHNHMATNNVIRNNLFLVEGDAKLTFPRSTGFTLERNILSATGKIRIEGENAVTRWSKNLFHSGANRIERVRLDQYSGRETLLGPPGDTVMADPLLVDPASLDFRFRTNSPALELGIEPIDIRAVGIRR